MNDKAPDPTREANLEIGVDEERKQVVLFLTVQDARLPDGKVKVAFYYTQAELARLTMTLVESGSALWVDAEPPRVVLPPR